MLLYMDVSNISDQVLEIKVENLAQKCQELNLDQARKRLSYSDHSHGSDSESASTVPGSPTTGDQLSENLDTIPSERKLSNGYSESPQNSENIAAKPLMPTTSMTLPSSNPKQGSDPVYECTTSVVRAVMQLLQGVQKGQHADYLELVKNVGIELRSLLAAVDLIVPQLPPWSHKEIEMAHSVLSKDMVNLVQAMKQAQRFAQTTLDSEYRKHMLSAAHIIAVNAKNLLDTVATVRTRVQSNLGPEDPLPNADIQTLAEPEMKSVIPPGDNLVQPNESSYYNIQANIVMKESSNTSQTEENIGSQTFIT